MAGEFKIKTGLLLGADPTQPVTSIADSSSFSADASSSLATVKAIHGYIETVITPINASLNDVIDGDSVYLQNASIGTGLTWDAGYLNATGVAPGVANGLQILGDGSMGLGGTLTQDTTIDAGPYKLAIGSGDIQAYSTTYAEISVSTGYVYMGALDAGQAGWSGIYTYGNGNLTIDFNDTATITDSSWGKGLIYAADYSATFIDRSLIDRGYLDACLGFVWTKFTQVDASLDDVVDGYELFLPNASIGTGLTWDAGYLTAAGGTPNVANGLQILADGSIGLGGAITENTTIDLGSNIFSIYDTAYAAGIEIDPGILILVGKDANYTGGLIQMDPVNYSNTVYEYSDGLTGYRTIISQYAEHITFNTGISGQDLIVTFDSSGFKYASDLSSTWGDRSLIDKGYLDACLGLIVMPIAGLGIDSATTPGTWALRITDTTVVGNELEVKIDSTNANVLYIDSIDIIQDSLFTPNGASATGNSLTFHYNTSNQLALDSYSIVTDGLISAGGQSSSSYSITLKYNASNQLVIDAEDIVQNGLISGNTSSVTGNSLLFHYTAGNQLALDSYAIVIDNLIAAGGSSSSSYSITLKYNASNQLVIDAEDIVQNGLISAGGSTISGSEVLLKYNASNQLCVDTADLPASGGSIGAANGLEIRVDGSIGLGGTLLGTTSINLDTMVFGIEDLVSGTGISLNPVSGLSYIRGFSSAGYGGQLNLNESATHNLLRFQETVTSDSTDITQYGNRIEFLVSVTSANGGVTLDSSGLRYSNYDQLNWDSTYLVHKGYVDSCIGEVWTKFAQVDASLDDVVDGYNLFLPNASIGTGFVWDNGYLNAIGTTPGVANGLQILGDGSIGLGGEISQQTTILLSNDLHLYDATTGTGVSISLQTGSETISLTASDAISGGNMGRMNLTPDYAYLVHFNASTASVIYLYVENDTVSIKDTWLQPIITFDASGIKYANDYSSEWGDRSVPDCAWVHATIGSSLGNVDISIADIYTYIDTSLAGIYTKNEIDSSFALNTDIILNTSIGTSDVHTVYWLNGFLEASLGTSSGGRVSQEYVDGSLSTLNSSVNTSFGLYATNASIGLAAFAKNASFGLYATNASIGLASFAKTSALGGYIPNSSIGIAGGVLAYRTFGTAAAADIGSGGVLAYRTFGTAANSAIGDFVAYRTFGSAANNNTGDFIQPNSNSPTFTGILSVPNLSLGDAAIGSNTLTAGILITLTASQTTAFGDVGYIASTGKVVLAKADAIANANAVVMCAASGGIAADAAGSWMTHGVARQDAWNWTVGGLIYLSTTGTTGNTLTQTIPSGSGNVIQVLGVATHADRMIFTPSLVQVEHI